MNRRQSLGGGGRGFISLKGKNLTYLHIAQNNVIMNNKFGEREVNMKKGFTLAEVLITLGIIGVVAALTMPTLMSNYRKHQTVTQLKKAYSEISQAIRLSESKYGTLETWDFANIGAGTGSLQERNDYFAENYLFPNIKVLKKCSPSSSECWADYVTTLNGIKDLSNKEGHSSFITASGYSVLYWLHGEDSASNGMGGWFYIDTNGPKKPNKIGIDIFAFVMSWGASQTSPETSCPRRLGLLPPDIACLDRNLTRDDIKNGTNLEKTSFACNSSQYGTSCSSLIMVDGWEIKDDYPWKW